LNKGKTKSQRKKSDKKPGGQQGHAGKGLLQSKDPGNSSDTPFLAEGGGI
jgi:hypothetical protein